MALPADGLPSVNLWTSPIRPPRDIVPTPFESWERGGVAIQDSSLGLDYYNWRIRTDPVTGEVFYSVPGSVSETLVYTIDPLPVHAVGSFGLNMNTIIAWTDIEGDTYLRWFDPTIPAFDVIQLPVGSISPRLVLDDVRWVPAGSGITDTVLFYLLDNTVYYRLLRDRFDTDYEYAGPFSRVLRIGRVGMNSLLRLQLELVFPNAHVMDLHSINFRVQLETERGFE